MRRSRRPLIAALALLCGACQTQDAFEGALEADSQNPTPRRQIAQELRWFAIASYIRQCNGPGSVRGAVWAATAASIGAAYYVRSGASVDEPEGRRKVSGLMDAAYKGRFGKASSHRNCARATAAVVSVYQRQSRELRTLIAQLAGTLLRSDRVGRTALAQAGRSRGASRRASLRRAARVRRAALKPSEQQIPIGE